MRSNNETTLPTKKAIAEAEQQAGRALVTADRALRDGALTVAYLGLSEAFGLTRDDEVRQALVHLGATLAEHRPGLTSRRYTYDEGSEWPKIAMDEHPVDTALLALHLSDGFWVKNAEMKERLSRIAQRPPDPRVFESLLRYQYRESVRYLESRELESANGALPKVFKAAFERALMQHFDPWFNAFSIPGDLRKSLDRKTKKVILAEAPGSAEIAELVREVLAKPIVKPKALALPVLDDAGTADQLYRAIGEGEEGAELVFADHVSESDPKWSEFIRLSLAETLTEKERKRLKSLSRKKEEFLGPVRGWVSLQGLHLHRGFLHTANVRVDEERAQQIGDASAFAVARALLPDHPAFLLGSAVSGLATLGTYFHQTAEGDWQKNKNGGWVESAFLLALHAQQPERGYSFSTLQVQLMDYSADGRSEGRALASLRLPQLKRLFLASDGRLAHIETDEFPKAEEVFLATKSRRLFVRLASRPCTKVVQSRNVIFWVDAKGERYVNRLNDRDWTRAHAKKLLADLGATLSEERPLHIVRPD